MNKRMIHLAGLTLAALIAVGPAFAQEQVEVKKRVTSDRSERPEKPERPERPEKSSHVERFEVRSDDDGPLALARSAAGETERTVKQIFGGQGPDRTTIVSSSMTDEKTLATLDEDMNIMARILDKAINHDDDDSAGDHKAMGIQLWALGGSNRGSRNLYIDGHGAIFIVNVNTLLIPPAEKAKPEEKKESSSTSWEEARRELYGRDDGGKRFSRQIVPDRPYDAERVESLKKNVAEALKNASNIRGLGDHEFVTVVLQGSGGGFRAVSSNRNDKNPEFFAYALSGQGGGGRSVMTIRAKKSDIDAFAKGKIEVDDFRKKLTITTYQTASGGDGARMKVGF